jgi:hypothetical protein
MSDSINAFFPKKIIKLPSEQKELTPGIFQLCEKLASIEIPESVVKIPFQQMSVKLATMQLIRR